MADRSNRVLELDRIETGYGKKQVLNGVHIHVNAGEIVALIGHNGAGKSTLLKTAFGLLPIWQGTITFADWKSHSPSPREMLTRGAAYVPQGNRVFTDLTVRENLELGATTLKEREGVKNCVERVLQVYPSLKDKLNQRAATLSGGEKQVLSLANAITVKPRLLLLDEPSLGLAPPLVTEAIDRVRQISEVNGIACLIVEQKVREVLRIADRVYVLRVGKVSFSGSADSLRDEEKLREVYL